MTNGMLSSAELMSDSAVYRRTNRGQRELLKANGIGSTPGLRVLARVNGFTDLRRLVDLAPGEACEMVGAIRQLYADGLIELVEEMAEDVSPGAGRAWL